MKKPLLSVVAGLGVVGLIFLLALFILPGKEEYKTSNIEELKKQVPFFAGHEGSLPEEDWGKLIVAEGLATNMEKVEYVFRPARGVLGSELSAKIILKESLDSAQLQMTLEKDLQRKGYKYRSNDYNEFSVFITFCKNLDMFYLRNGYGPDDEFPTKLVELHTSPYRTCDVK